MTFAAFLAAVGAATGHHYSEDSVEGQDIKKLWEEVCGWKPIEEAPKDGSMVLAWFPTAFGRGAWLRATWDNQRYHSKPKPHWAPRRAVPYATEYKANQPTHFRPLPEPPEVEGA